MYTVRHLIDANRKALVDRTLGAFISDDCLYNYGNGYHCAIGAVLNIADLQLIEINDANHSPLVGLINGGLIEVENITVFTATQKLHDSWLSGFSFSFGDYIVMTPNFPTELHMFLTQLVGQGVEEMNFIQWIDLLNKHFPAKAEGDA